MGWAPISRESVKPMKAPMVPANLAVLIFGPLLSMACLAHPITISLFSDSSDDSNLSQLLGLYLAADPVPVSNSLLVSFRSDQGLVLADDGTVALWRNGLSNQFASVVETGAAPSFLASDAKFNGWPSIVFSGAGMEYLDLTLGDHVTYFVVLRHSGAGVRVILEHGEDTNDASGGGMYLAASNTNTSAFRRGPGLWPATMSARDADPNWATTNDAIVVTAQYAGSHESHILRFNGTEPATTASLTNSSVGSLTASLFFGGRPRPTPSLYMDGAIAEILVYDRALALDEIQSVESYLLRRYRP